MKHVLLFLLPSVPSEMCIWIFFKKTLSSVAYLVDTHPRTADVRANVSFKVLTEMIMTCTFLRDVMHRSLMKVLNFVMNFCQATWRHPRKWHFH